MRRAEQELLSKRVVHYYENFANRRKSTTVLHFTREGYPRRTIYNVLQRFEARHESGFRMIPGRPTSIATPRVLRQLATIFKNKPSTSVREASQRLKVPKSTVQRMKKDILCLRGFVKQKAPKYVKNQESRAKSGCRKIYRAASGKILIMDDETYVPKDPADVTIHKFYHAQNRKDVKYEERVKPKCKFTQQYLIWQAIDDNGHISDAYVSERTMNASIYVKECLKKRLLPFIRKYHNMANILFWPDLSTSHYAKETIAFLESHGVPYVKKKDNAPNVPQARGVERFWALCKRRYSGRPNAPLTITGFRRVWSNISKGVAAESGQVIMRSAKRRLRTIGYTGVQGAD